MYINFEIRLPEMKIEIGKYNLFMCILLNHYFLSYGSKLKVICERTNITIMFNIMKVFKIIFAIKMLE